MICLQILGNLGNITKNLYAEHQLQHMSNQNYFIITPPSPKKKKIEKDNEHDKKVSSSQFLVKSTCLQHCYTKQFSLYYFVAYLFTAFLDFTIHCLLF